MLKNLPNMSPKLPDGIANFNYQKNEMSPTHKHLMMNNTDIMLMETMPNYLDDLQMHDASKNIYKFQSNPVSHGHMNTN